MGRWLYSPVALKIFHRQLVNESTVHHIDQEIDNWACIRHPNVVTLFGIISESFPPVIVMEVLEGSLAQVIVAALRCNYYMSIREKLDLALGSSAGIAHIHGLQPKPLLHGDIRPSNILVTSQMVAKIGDLGASHFVGAYLSVGPLSCQYVAPERMPNSTCRAIGNTTTADVYSLGVSFVELFTGIPADPTSTQRHVQAIEHFQLKDICIQMTEEEPDQRAAARDVLDVIGHLCDSKEYQGCPGKRMVRRQVGGKVDLV